MRRVSVWKLLFVLSILVLSAELPVYADGISFRVSNSSLSTTSGGTVTFEGTITNDSGGDLNASDFFFNFFGFDATAVNPVQDLGVATDFLIPNGSTSSLVAFFDVTLGSVPDGSSFPIQVQLEDINADLSDVQTVTVLVSGNGGGGSVPEPATFLLLAAGLGTAYITRCRRRKSGSGAVRRWFPATLFFAAAILGTASRSFGQTGSPAFSTQTPESGIVGNSFDVLLPFVNTGTASANGVTVTSVLLGRSTQTNLTLPLLLGSLDPNDPHQLDLQFDATSLVSGANYLLTLRGTYQQGTTVLGFAVNRFVRVAPPSQSVQADLTRWIAMDALRTVVTALPHSDPVADAQSILTFLQSRPEFIDAGSSADSTSVWARFAADGLPIVVDNDDFVPISDSSSAAAMRSPFSLPPHGGNAPRFQTIAARIPRPTAAALPMPPQGGGGAAPMNMPVSSVAHLFDAVTQLEPDTTVVSDISSWLNTAKYVAIPKPATVGALKTVGGDGIFFFRTHGGFAPPGPATDVPVFNLWTSDRADVNNSVTHVQDGDVLDDDSPLVLVLAEQSDKVQEFHWAITNYFVQKYWGNFAANSLVYIDACNSDDPDFRQRIFNKKASVYAGWSQATGDPLAAITARLVFDRLLGANKFCPENDPSTVTNCVAGSASGGVFAQRPFDYVSVQNKEFEFHDAGTFKDVNSKHFGLTLNFTRNPGTLFGLLAPSISNMMVDETKGQNGQLTINGIFGSDPGSVSVGGQDVNVESWSSNQVVVDLNLTGAGSAGDVIVTVRNHKSNVAQLTEWNGNNFTWTINGVGSEQLQTVFNPHLRIDIRKYRPAIHDAPIEPTGVTIGASDSTGTYTASGSGPVGSGTGTAKWSGTGSLLGFTLNIPITGAIIFSPTMQITDSHNIQSFMSSATEANSGAVCTTKFPMSPPNIDTLPVEGPSNLLILIGDVGPRSFHFALDDNAVIQKSSFGAQGQGLFKSYFCMDDNQTATYNFTWGPQAPTDGTAPDPKSAR